MWEAADFETGEFMLKALGVENWRRNKTDWIPMSDRTERDRHRLTSIHYLSQFDLKKFPCKDLQIINDLWMEASQGKFGFSIQNAIYKSVGKQYQSLGDRVGWKVQRTWALHRGFHLLEKRNYILVDQRREAVDLKTGERWKVNHQIWLPWWEMTFSLEAPPGHLPAAFWSWWVMMEGHKKNQSVSFRDWIGTLLERVNDCRL